MERNARPYEAFPVYKTNVIPSSDAFKTNMSSWTDVLKRYDEVSEWAVGEGKQQHIE